jgi:Fic family protein
MFELTDKYYAKYHDFTKNEIAEGLVRFDFSEINIDFTHRIRASAIFSSNIEGNSIDLNSYLNWKSIIKSKPSKEIKEINDLVTAYEWARIEPLTEKSVLQVHKILSQQILIKSKRGKYRQDQVGVFGESGLIYLAVEPEFVGKVMHQFFEQITRLLQTTLTTEEVFYYAAFIHLRFVHIHPFADGNGRVARLLEKWFLSQKLGDNYWKIPSEKYYKENIQAYYTNIDIGVNYYELNYNKCMPFLTMLPQALKLK